MKKIGLLLSFIFTVSLQATIVETHHIADILCYIDEPNTLVIFDIDTTLAELEFDAGSDPWFYAMFKRELHEGKTPEQLVRQLMPLWLSIQLVSWLKPVEKVAPFLVKDLQRQGFKVLALTARSLPSVNRTIEQLNHIDIDFTISGLAQEEISLELDYPCKHKKGVVFVGLNHKGKVLLSLLDYVGFHPKRVVFIDDKMKNIKAVKEAVEARGIEFVGLRYGRLDEKIENFDLDKANEQLEGFFEMGELHHIDVS